MNKYTWSGEGKKEKPYLMESKEHLLELGLAVKNSGDNEPFKGKYFSLKEDIILDSEGWETIGNSSKEFAGFFNGENRKISNIKITDVKISGLFAKLGKNACVTNLVLEGSIRAKLNGGAIGLIAGLNYGTITDCQCSASLYIADEQAIISNNTYAGIVAGSNEGNIENCTIHGKIHANIYPPRLSNDKNFYAGGIAGINYASINGCMVYVDVDDKTGILKQAENGKFPIYVRALCGINNGNGLLKDCFIPSDVAPGDIPTMVGYIQYTHTPEQTKSLREQPRMENCGRLVRFNHSGLQMMSAIIAAGEQVSIIETIKNGGCFHMETTKNELKDFMIDAAMKWGNPGKTYHENYDNIIFSQQGCLRIYGNGSISANTLINEKGFTTNQYEFKIVGDDGVDGEPGKNGTTPEPSSFTINIGELKNSIKVISTGGAGGRGGTGVDGEPGAKGGDAPLSDSREHYPKGGAGGDGGDGKKGGNGGDGGKGPFVTVSYGNKEPDADIEFITLASSGGTGGVGGNGGTPGKGGLNGDGTTYAPDGNPGGRGDDGENGKPGEPGIFTVKTLPTPN